MATLAPAPTFIVGMEDAMARIANLVTVWTHANSMERRELAGTLFGAVQCDTDAKRVVAARLKRALFPLKSALPSVLYECGSDGIPHPIHPLSFPEELDRLVA